MWSESANVRDVGRRRVTLARISMLLGLLIAFGCGGAEDEPAPASPAERKGPTEVEMVAAMEAHYSTTILAHAAPKNESSTSRTRRN